jgi:hypothetical protein
MLRYEKHEFAKLCTINPKLYQKMYRIKHWLVKKWFINNKEIISYEWFDDLDLAYIKENLESSDLKFIKNSQ